MSELIRVENGEISVAEEAMKQLRLLPQLELLQKRLRGELLEAMKNNGVKSFENDEIRITYVDAFDRTTVDTKALKEDGLYENYTKTSKVAESVKIEWK